MASQSFNLIISIDAVNSVVKFYSVIDNNKNKITMDIKPYKTNGFGDQFFEVFSSFLQEYSKANPAVTNKAMKVAILVPNYLLATDMIVIPGVNKQTMDNLIKVALENRYANIKDLKINIKDLKINSIMSLKTKRNSSYAVSVMRLDLIQKIYKACAENSMMPQTITCQGNAGVDGFMALNTKCKGKSFVFADIKEKNTTLSFVSKGEALGFYDLPFGYAILDSEKVVAENMLFDHSVAELAVLNAKEKAKAKQLTMMGANVPMEEVEADANKENDPFASEMEVPKVAPVGVKVLPKKTPRVFPKFMQRPVPEDPAGFECENFRIFQKWMLELVRANLKLNGSIAYDEIYVNMPSRFDHIFTKMAEEEAENGIKIVSAGLQHEKELVVQNLELFGGLYTGQFNKHNNF